MISFRNFKDAGGVISWEIIFTQIPIQMCFFLWRGLRCKNCEHSGLGIIWLQGLWRTLVCWTVRRFHRFYNHMHIKWLICLALFAYTRPVPCLRMAWLIVSLVGVAPTVLTHLGRGKMAVISQPKFSNAFFSLKTFEFRLTFHWNLFVREKLTIFHHWSR